MLRAGLGPSLLALTVWLQQPNPADVALENPGKIPTHRLKMLATWSLEPDWPRSREKGNELR